MKKAILSLTTVLVITTVFSANQAFGQRTVKAKIIPALSQSSVRDATEKIIREYLLKNPEIVREAMQALQAKEEMQRNLAAAANMKKFAAEIYSDAESPIAGNASGDVSVVVFYDYFCGYCKRTLPALDSLVANDSGVKVIYKEFPIMGPQSMTAAKAALAAARQGKFAAFHQALIEAESASDETVKAIAEKLVIDYARLQKDMTDPKIDAAIARNVKLAESLNINGTPAYLIGDQFIPGAVDTEALARMIGEQRVKLAKSERRKTDKSKGLN